MNTTHHETLFGKYDMNVTTGNSKKNLKHRKKYKATHSSNFSLVLFRGKFNTSRKK
jgi:hypothetical protein